MFPVFQIGHVVFQAPGLILIAGVWLGLMLADHYAPTHGVSPARLDNLVFISLAAGAVGGRLSYALENIPAFSASPISLISLNYQLFDLLGGLLIGLAAAIVYASRSKLKPWDLVDALTPGFAVMAVALGVSTLAAGSAFGLPARLPWSIYLWGEWRHPTQVYQILGTTGILIWLAARQTRENQPGQTRPAPGKLFLEFAALTGALTLFLEAYRGDSALIFGQFRAAQVGAWLVLALSLTLLNRSRNENRRAEVVYPQ